MGEGLWSPSPTFPKRSPKAMKWETHSITRVGALETVLMIYISRRADLPRGSQQVRFCFCKKRGTLEEAGRRLRQWRP